MSEITILALDPSTEATGAVVVRYLENGTPVVLDRTEIQAHIHPKSRRDLTARYQRISQMQGGLTSWAANLPYAVDLVAYERPCARGNAASEALHGVVGALMSATPCVGLPVAEVNTSTAQRLYWCGQFRRYQTDAEKREARKRRKSECIAWARDRFGVELAETDDAVADALAVAEAAYRAN